MAKLIEKQREKNSKTFSYTVSELGVRLTDEYYKVRAEILVKRLEEISDVSEKFDKASRFLSLLTGIYEEAARDSATITPLRDDEPGEPATDR
ncbi:hypothetical protein D3C72_2290080 [compost metagenome]